MNDTGVSSEVRERIINAAVELYAENEERIPTVDQVRRAARADMNTTSLVMKEWRRKLTAKAAPVAIAVPEVVSSASNEALVVVWQKAQELANESLENAQKSWQAERNEMDSLRKELSDAYEELSLEYEKYVSTAEESYQEGALLQSGLEQQLASVRKELTSETARAERAEAKAEAVEDRVSGLSEQLERSYKHVDEFKASIKDKDRALKALEKELAQARTEIASILSKKETLEVELQSQQRALVVQTEKASEQASKAAAQYERAVEQRDEAQALASQAREQAAELKGQLEAHKEQVNSLLGRLAPTERHSKKG